MDAVKFLKEKDRLTKKCSIKCGDCRLNDGNCFEGVEPERVVEIIEQWSKDYPKATYRSELLKRFPKASIENNCVLNLWDSDEVKCFDYKNCDDCWNEKI